MTKNTALCSIAALLLGALSIPAAAPAQVADLPDAPDARHFDGDEDEDKPEAAANGFTQPEIDELPEQDERAVKKLRKAWESVYSAEEDGMTRLYSDATVKADLSAYEEFLKRMGMDTEFELEAKMGWSAEEGASMKVMPSDQEGGGQLVRGMQNLAGSYTQIVQFLIGLPKFDEHFKDAVIVEDDDYETEDEDFKRADFYRVWREQDGEFVSELYFVNKKEIVRIFSADTDLRFEQEKVGKIEQFSKITLRTVVEPEVDDQDDKSEGEDKEGESDSDSQRRGGGNGWGRGGRGGRGGAGDLEGSNETVIVFEVKEREQVSAYTIASKISTTYTMMRFEIDVDLELSDPLVDDEVTDEMLESARPDQNPGANFGRRERPSEKDESDEPADESGKSEDEDEKSSDEE